MKLQSLWILAVAGICTMGTSSCEEKPIPPSIDVDSTGVPGGGGGGGGTTDKTIGSITILTKIQSPAAPPTGGITVYIFRNLDSAASGLSFGTVVSDGSGEAKFSNLKGGRTYYFFGQKTSQTDTMESAVLLDVTAVPQRDTKANVVIN